MKKKCFLLLLFSIIAMLLVGCNGGDGATTPPVIGNQSPTASFTANPTSGVAPLEITFNASSSSDSDGSITSYAWDFKAFTHKNGTG